MEKTLWRRNCVQLNEYLEEMVAYWSYVGDERVYNVTVRDFFSDWGSVKQISIFKERLNPDDMDEMFDKEPNMSEKRFVLNGVKAYSSIENAIAFEVFPSKDNIVDKMDIYHVWILEKKNIPFYVDLKIPKFIWNWKKITINNKNVTYTMRTYSSKRGRPIRVYFVRTADDTELKWYDKQIFKDTMIGEEIVAIEFVSDKAQKFSILVCAPKSIKKLPFGLR